MKNNINSEEEYYVKIISKLQDEYNQAIDALNELSYSIYCLEEIKNIKSEKDVLFPFLNGILIEGKINKTNSIKMNVGGGVIVTKSIDEAIKFLKEKQKKLMQEANEIKNQIDVIVQVTEGHNHS